MANELKRKRRLEMGDADPSGAQTVSNDPTSGIPAQPMPGMPQGKGNMMNNPQVELSMGGGAHQPGGPGMYPYGDGGIGFNDPRNGSVGFAPRTKMPENLVPGTKLNQVAYGSMIQPQEGMSQAMLYPMAMAQEAANRASRLYAASGDPTPSYQVGQMGMMGTPLEIALKGKVNPGQMMSDMSGQTPGSLPLQGNTTQSVQSGNPGMSTGRGGGRNQLA
ncbi:MAG: hypothetical protein CMJ25_10905 [Phycisphaerae bacterium]|nr:hypothetical protein [Phycisphaerae bacterium]|tara:strand:+ start:1083 stop:1739 length:657 start_codon:yes stop_codon:yes gene_type:complete